MRILIGFHGSEASRVALYDLASAGLSDETEVLILTAVESLHTRETSFDASCVAASGVAMIQKVCPKWVVKSETVIGSPPIELLNRAESFKPDLIVVGGPQHNLRKHNVSVGPTSQAMLVRAKCSVRIAKTCVCPALLPKRILVGFNGSAASNQAVEMIVSRKWPPDTEMRLLLAADSLVMGSIGRFAPQMNGAATEIKLASQWAKGLASAASAKLTRAGISSSVEVRFGHPKDVIVEEAKKWNADTVFVGSKCAANSHDRFLLEGVSATVAAEAHCSVEVVRRGA